MIIDMGEGGSQLSRFSLSLSSVINEFLVTTDVNSFCLYNHLPTNLTRAQVGVIFLLHGNLRDAPDISPKIAHIKQALRGTREAAMDWYYVGSLDK